MVCYMWCDGVSWYGANTIGMSKVCTAVYVVMTMQEYQQYTID